MESVNLDMDDLFDGGGTGANLEDDFDQPQHTFAEFDGEAEEGPMRAEGGDNVDDDDQPNEDVLAKLKDLKGAAKKKVTHRHPKLDADRLRSEKGIAALPKLFDNVKFKGKGHEADDLKKLMSGLEHWAHRLYPKLTFTDFIERLEKLGGKREVQNQIKRIRLDMPIFDEDRLASDNEDNLADDEGDPFAGVGVSLPTAPNEMDAEEMYDAMLQQEREKMADEFADDLDAMASGADDTLTTPRPAKAAPPSQTGMTPEMKERMERNKMNALKKKAARLGVPVESLLPPKPVSEASPSKPAEAKSPVNDKAASGGNLSDEEEMMDALMIDEGYMERSKEQSSPSLHLRLSESLAGASEGMELKLTETCEAANSLNLNLSIDGTESDNNTCTTSEKLDLKLTETCEASAMNLNLSSDSLEDKENAEESLKLHLSDSAKHKVDSLNLRLSDTECESDHVTAGKVKTDHVTETGSIVLRPSDDANVSHGDDMETS